jgi:hypothetical protein
VASLNSDQKQTTLIPLWNWLPVWPKPTRSSPGSVTARASLPWPPRPAEIRMTPAGPEPRRSRKIGPDSDSDGWWRLPCAALAVKHVNVASADCWTRVRLPPAPPILPWSGCPEIPRAARVKPEAQIFRCLNGASATVLTFMGRKKTRTRSNRRDRRKAKASGWRRQGRSNPKKVGHGGSGQKT